MSIDSEKPIHPRGPYSWPAKYMNGDRSMVEADGRPNPARAPGHRPLEREAEAAMEGRDASGAGKETAPQQSREAMQRRH